MVGGALPSGRFCFRARSSQSCKFSKLSRFVMSYVSAMACVWERGGGAARGVSPAPATLHGSQTQAGGGRGLTSASSRYVLSIFPPMDCPPMSQICRVTFFSPGKGASVRGGWAVRGGAGCRRDARQRKGEEKQLAEQRRRSHTPRASTRPPSQLNKPEAAGRAKESRSEGAGRDEDAHLAKRGAS